MLEGQHDQQLEELLRNPPGLCNGEVLHLPELGLHCGGGAWGGGSAAGEESDFSCAASELSGRSTARPSRARSPNGSLCGGDWWGHDAASETDSCLDEARACHAHHDWKLQRAVPAADTADGDLPIFGEGHGEVRAEEQGQVQLRPACDDAQAPTLGKRQRLGCVEGEDAGLGRLLPPSDSETAPGAAGSSISMTGTLAADSDCNELVRFLKDKGLSAIAVRFSETMGMELVEDLGRLQAADLDHPDLSFLWQWQRAKLLELVQSIPAGSARLRDNSLDASDLDLSGAEAPSAWDLPAAEIASILFQYRQDPSAFLCAGTRLPPVFKTWPSRKPWPGIERVCEGKGMPMMELERGVKWPMVWIRCESCLCHLYTATVSHVS